MVVGTVMVMAGSMIKLPLLILSPGPTYNTIGEVDGEPLITISGTTTYPTAGAAGHDHHLRAGRVLGRGVPRRGAARVGVPGAVSVPAGVDLRTRDDRAEVSKRNDQLFALLPVGLDRRGDEGGLGIPTQEAVVVTLVGGGSPADGIVQAGDQILTVDGQDVSTPAEVGELVREREVGDTVVLEVLRSEEPGAEPTQETLEVVTAVNPTAQAEDPQASPQAYLGIVVGIAYRAPFDIEFGDSNVGGPSAGMMFSLGIIDMLTDDQLNGGQHVAGTGTIDPEGNVGPIGGIQQKLVGAKRAGATLFVAPQDNCDDVEGEHPRWADGGSGQHARRGARRGRGVGRRSRGRLPAVRGRDRCGRTLTRPD